MTGLLGNVYGWLLDLTGDGKWMLGNGMDGWLEVE